MTDEKFLVISTWVIMALLAIPFLLTAAGIR